MSDTGPRQRVARDWWSEVHLQSGRWSGRRVLVVERGLGLGIHGLEKQVERGHERYIWL